MRQRWETVVASWIEKDSPILKSVLEQREFLAQVFPPDEVAKPPARLSLMD